MVYRMSTIRNPNGNVQQFDSQPPKAMPQLWRATKIQVDVWSTIERRRPQKSAVQMGTNIATDCGGYFLRLTCGVAAPVAWPVAAGNQAPPKSTYVDFCIGDIPFEPWKLIWKSWTPKKCQFFLWLVVHNRSVQQIV